MMRAAVIPPDSTDRTSAQLSATANQFGEGGELGLMFLSTNDVFLL